MDLKHPLAAIRSTITPEDEKAIVQICKPITHKIDIDKPVKKPDRKQRLLEDIYQLKAAYIWRFEHVNRTETLKRLPGMQKEIAAIKALPELFADNAEYEKYFDTVNRWLCQLIEIITMQRERKCSLQKIRDELNEDKLRRLRPSYTEEHVAKPWMQFMHHEAPGWPVDMGSGPNVIAKQRIPNAGILLVGKWENEVKQILDFLDSQIPPGPQGQQAPSRFKSGLLEGQKVVFISKDGKTKNLMLSVIPRSPYHKLYEFGQGFYEGDLFPISKIIGRLDGVREAPLWRAAVVQIKGREENKDEEIVEEKDTEKTTSAGAQ